MKKVIPDKKFKCLVCKNANYDILDLAVRETGYKILQCKNCNLRQLFKENLYNTKNYYENDTQDSLSFKYTNITKIEQINHRHCETKNRAKIIQNIISNKKDEIHIIDVGGGYGNLLNEIKKLNIKMDLLEPRKLKDIFYTKNNINLINSFFNEKFVENNKNKYDIVICCHTLEHLKNPVEFLKNIKQIMKKKSHLFLEVPNDDLDLIKICKKYSKNVNYIEPHLSYFTPETLKYTLNKAGLLNTTIKGFQIYGYQNYKDIKDNGFKFKKNVKDIDLFKNNYKKNSKEEKWYNDRIQNLTCDTIYIIYSN